SNEVKSEVKPGEFMERLQSEDRLRRSGSRNPVTYIDLFADRPIDRALNDAIDRMITNNQTSSAEDLLATVRSMCAEVSASDLRAAIEVHRANCHQPSCPVLVVMEASAKEEGRS